jgi:hypothetical protein
MGARLYLDLVKRCVTHFLHTDFPSGQGEEQYKGMRAWDIPYRMRYVCIITHTCIYEYIVHVYIPDTCAKELRSEI